MVKNNKGWIKIVEAFIAILLIMGVLLILINRGYIGEKDISSQVYDMEVSILREIQLNDTLRDKILNAGEPPIEWEDVNFPLDIKNKIINRIQKYLECKAKICKMDEICELKEYPEKDVYAQAVAITTTLQTPEEKQLKQLKLFCWVR